MRAFLFIALGDLLLCVLAVVISAVNPRHADAGMKPHVEYIIQANWSLEDGHDEDVDLWMLPPPGTVPVFYRNRQAGLVLLDQDCLGKSNSTVLLADGSVVAAKECRETISIRGIVPGKYDLALNLYSARDERGIDIRAGKARSIVVHTEIIQVNPQIQTMWKGDITLDEVHETKNWASFTLTAENRFEMVPVPLDPITNKFLTSN